MLKNKELHLEDIVEKVKIFRQSGKIVVQSHGVFDLIHPGVIKHLNSAKKQGDILIVTVIKDKDVRKGPGRPIFPEKMRLENVTSLKQVDYACLVDDEIPFECVKRINPDVFAKGKAYRDRDHKIHTKIYKKERDIYFEKIKIYETDGFSFSSSQIINNYLDIYTDETKQYLNEFSKKYKFNDIVEKLNALNQMNILLIGDGIIDEYHYVTPMGKSAKANLVVNKYIAHEVFPGGVFAIANHLASFCDNVHLLTLLGRDDPREDFISNNLKPNINYKYFYRSEGPTIVKKRYINQYFNNQKLFEVNYMDDTFIDETIETEIIDYLKSEISKYDLVLISDFGHGFITEGISRIIESTSKLFGVNTQTNGANVGYNLITKYCNPNYVCLDEPEIRLAAQEKYGNIEDILKKISLSLNSDYLITTLGKKGSIGITKDGEINRTPIFSSKVVDTVGAGDAFFAYTAPCVAQGMPLELISFIGNAVGALAVQIVGNKKSVEKYELLEFIHTILK